MNKKILSGILTGAFLLSGLIAPISAQTVQESSSLVAQSTQTLTANADSDFTFSNGVINKYKGLGAEVVIPEYINGEKVINVSYAAFADNRVVTSVVIPDTVTVLGKEAFSGCVSLKSVEVGSAVTYINEATFAGCTSLESVTLPGAITTLSDRAFEGCTALQSIDIPATVTSIGQNVFTKCSSLTFVKLPEGLQVITPELFKDCSSLTYVHIPSSVYSIGKEAFSGTALTAVNIPSSVTTIEESTFADTDLLTVTIPNSVTTIQRYAFSNCSNLIYVDLPDSLTTIEQSAFTRCTAMHGIYIPNSVTSIGVNAFKDCAGNPTNIYSTNNSYVSSYASSNALRPVEGTDPVKPDTSVKIASPSSAKVMVNEKEVPFAAYTIDGFNYFKLTDMSYALMGTSKQFRVNWDMDRSAIDMVTGESHVTLGTELQGGTGNNETAERFLSTVFQDGKAIYVTVYTIDGSSYFQLDTLKEVIGLNVGWNSSTSTITITT